MKTYVFDIETFPNVGYSWGKWEQNILHFERQHKLAMFAYKELGKKKVYVYGLPDFPRYKKDKFDDTDLVKKLWEIFNEADILIAHNGNSFDIKQSNTFFIEHGLTPPSPYQTIDTKLVAKRYFRYNSNSLNDLGAFLKLGKKEDTGGFKLWLDCMEGKEEAWKTMRKYNIQDVRLLESIYDTMRPWMNNHPTDKLYSKETGCPRCHGPNVTKRGIQPRATGWVQEYMCKDCRKRSWGEIIEKFPTKTMVS